MSAARSVWSFDAIGTRWQIETPEPLAAAVRAEVDALIDAFDLEWSRFRPDSVVASLAATGGVVSPPPVDATVMLDAYAAMAEATRGAVNPLVGGALARRGYDAALTLHDAGAEAAPADWRARLAWDESRLRLDGPGVIDVGALGKGRLVDLVTDLLAARVGTAFVVDASGDVRVIGTPERIGLEHPFDARRAIGVIELRDGALCASATNRRAWGEGLHHILDARTGHPVRTIAATWAVAPDAMRADAVATALFFDGGAELAHDWGVEWVRMTSDGRVEWSPGSRAELFGVRASVER